MTERRVIPMKKEATQKVEKPKKTVEQQEAEISEKYSFPYIVMVRAAIVNVRSEPTAASGITAQLSRGQTIKITEEINGWGKLMSGAGWIYLEYTERRNELCE